VGGPAGAGALALTLLVMVGAWRWRRRLVGRPGASDGSNGDRPPGG
jgi:MYXO-CTERM domain-containing protein